MEVYDYTAEKKKKKVKKGIIAIVAVIILIIAAAISADIYMQVIQLDEIGGYSTIYLRNLYYKVISFIAAFILVFIATAITNAFVRKNLRKYCDEKQLPQKRLPNLPFAAIIAFFGALITRNAFYMKALSFLNAAYFGKQDPVFGNDIGYYIFQRPFLMSLTDFFTGLWIFIIIYSAGYYLAVILSYNATPSLNDLKVKYIIRHNLFNIAILFVIKALSYKFKMEGILYSSVVNLKGAGYIDVNVWLKYYTAAPFLLLIIVVAAIFFLLKNKIKRAVISIAVFPAIWIIVFIISQIVQGLIVTPNEFNLESKYISYNIDKTREAYGLDKIKTYQFPNIEPLTPEILNRNKQTKDNIRVVDYQSTLLSNIQMQSNTLFYTFVDGDIINYTINGKEMAVFITAREIDKSRLQEKTYINTTYRYTHGYGIVMNPINRLQSGGQVDFILSDLRLKTIDPSLKVTRPEIYYGENTKDHVIVGASNGLDEIDYDGNSYTRYQGAGGIKLAGLNRLLFALKYGDFNMITSGYAKNSTLLLNREIIDRAQKAVPFLTIDSDPYILLGSDGRLKWVIDAYTTSNSYPYAQGYGSFNYIRNSVKIIVDAYDGKVKCYIIDNNDPVIQAYKRIYPGVFSEEPLPSDVTAHMRYPEALFKVQTEILKMYHLDSTQVAAFYGQQDRWDIAKYAVEKSSDNLTDIEPYYNMIKLPEGIGDSEELILMRPFTPSGAQKHNMVSWLAVRNSGKSYGEMILFQFPKNTNIFGPNQVEVKINQLDSVSRDMTLWGQSGSDVYKGSLLVIPIENSILYVEPIYIKAAGESSTPEVREIVVGFQDEDEFRYGVGTSLDKALSDLFETDQAAPAAPQQPTDTENRPVDNTKALDDILKKYDEIKKQLDELGSLIEKLR